MGAGDRSRLLRTAIDTYDEYRDLRDDGFGHFVLSVFAAHAGYSVRTLCDALPWRWFGTCPAGALRKHFSLIATTILTPDGEPAGELQVVHYDVVLRHPDDDRLLVPGALAHDDDSGTELLTAVESFLVPSKTFALLFEPRLDKKAGNLDDGDWR
jgi:hypothetical protein